MDPLLLDEQGPAQCLPRSPGFGLPDLFLPSECTILDQIGEVTADKRAGRGTEESTNGGDPKLERQFSKP